MNAPLPEVPGLPTSAQGRLQRLQGWFDARPPGTIKRLKRAGMLVGTLLFFSIISVPFDLLTQGVFGVMCFFAAVLLRRSASRLAILAMIVLSLVMSLRYVYWRMTSTLGFENSLDMVFGLGLLLAELYALVVLLCGYLQTCWPLRRNPVLMQGAPDTWPVVDVFIPTYNESLSIVKLTLFAAQAIDWPRDKLRVHLLDDGKRDEFREFCAQIGVNYITRDNNLHAKAGNLNEALKVTDGEYVAIFDADHVPTRSFLQMGMGWFIKDPRLSMLQTPHFFFSPDPFEKNLDTFRSVPNENELFYGVVQDGSDLWNAAFFCGSCAIIRRQALEEIGGVATETVTEDAHTALKLSRAGYNTAYLAIPQAAGLATESLSRHIRQRVRWARGMAQIFRTDNPLLGRGLTLGQRFCYFNAMLHFFYGLPRLVFLTAPLAFLFFDARIFHASALMIAVYVLPHILHSSLTNSTMQGRFRHSFWNEVYETVLAWYILGPVIMALVNPRFGGFNVTDKGGIIDEKFFEWRLARPYIVLLGLNLCGLVVALTMLVRGSNEEGVAVTVLINLAWTLYNIMITGAAVAVASETRQVRREPRVAASLPIRLERADGSVLDAVTLDFSQQGLGLRLPEGQGIARGEALQVVLFRKDTLSRFPATVVFSHGSMAGVQFDPLTLRQQSDLVRLTFSRADTWAATWGRGAIDTPLKAMCEVCKVSLRGVRELLSATRQAWHTRRTVEPAGDSVMEKS
ncbi:cellulose synthase [Pseudomonas sp. Leaf127]|uniref:UDP-forming cellulose synthase catalytic subunit n=1 Tax=Pseudomonas sp. Leaf127 TaxID=1736267 RepID=UPI0007027AB7|nr:UDP-forming cellulose synthase catalytic subunit [Pseudomonas sp. Leaf127]KQQ65535.1 cellulose synthase [Pseudomonas sp. Leaf127]